MLLQAASPMTCSCPSVWCRAPWFSSKQAFLPRTQGQDEYIDRVVSEGKIGLAGHQSGDVPGACPLCSLPGSAHHESISLSELCPQQDTPALGLLKCAG